MEGINLKTLLPLLSHKCCIEWRIPYPPLAKFSEQPNNAGKAYVINKLDGVQRRDDQVKGSWGCDFEKTVGFQEQFKDLHKVWDILSRNIERVGGTSNEASSVGQERKLSTHVRGNFLERWHALLQTNMRVAPPNTNSSLNHAANFSI
jgi:hypothetical protein